ncbi:DinB family protein [Cohnella pontilimi]|uniref:DinB family protein n=1 Tax=Cohnella pontilimi TaxID=2564100 RepID=A0A4U0FDM0_9BACL|nr:DinB family protein [Cohnella pontilimi]TJY41362.1 DinB family protein [Cohnella pontilimi]
MNQRPAKDEYNAFYEKYVQLVPEGNLIDILANQMEETKALLSNVSDTQADFRYAPDKWSLKEVLGHVTDNERIMGYRLLMIARGSQSPIAGYDQEAFVRAAGFESAAFSHIVADYEAVRRSTLTLLAGLPEEAWVRRGTANNFEVSVRAIAWIITGHETHHLNIIRGKYLG